MLIHNNLKNHKHFKNVRTIHLWVFSWPTTCPVAWKTSQ